MVYLGTPLLDTVVRVNPEAGHWKLEVDGPSLKGHAAIPTVLSDAVIDVVLERVVIPEAPNETTAPVDSKKRTQGGSTEHWPTIHLA